MRSQGPFVPVVGWEHQPKGYVHRDGSDVAVDSQDQVYLLTRSDSRVMVFDRTGEFLRSWGEGVLSGDPHGITIGPDDSVYCVDRGDHTVRRFTIDGTPLATFGISGVASATGFNPAVVDTTERERQLVGGPPFNRPTKAAIGPDGDIYVSDGYGNARIHRFAANGTLLQSWGEPGPDPGQFRIPHSVCVTPDGRVLVADRENSRIQVFTLEGRLIEVWNHLQRPQALALDASGHIYVGEVPESSQNSSSVYKGTESLPGRLCVLDTAGVVIERMVGGAQDEFTTGAFIAIHGMAVDSHGDVYITENAETGRRSLGLTYDPSWPVIQKFTRHPTS